jgi:hypothetical protein
VEGAAVPLLDHFHTPLSDTSSWVSFLSNWATRLADALTDLVPGEFRVEEHAHHGPSVEIHVSTFKSDVGGNGPQVNGPSAALLAAPAYAPPAPPLTMPATFPDTFEVRVFSTMSGKTLVAAIELVSPGNKDRPDERRAFAAKCASYLSEGISLIVMDIVTNRRANLHNETMRLMEAAPELSFRDDVSLYAVAYRPVRRDGRSEIDLWPTPVALGEELPTLPLRLTGDLFVPVDFEGAYREACRRRRPTGLAQRGLSHRGQESGQVGAHFLTADTTAGRALRTSAIRSGVNSPLRKAKLRTTFCLTDSSTVTSASAFRR